MDDGRPPSARLTQAATVFDRTTLFALLAIVLFNVLVGIVLLCHSLPHHLRVLVDNLTQCIDSFLVFVWALWSAIAASKKMSAFAENLDNEVARRTQEMTTKTDQLAALQTLTSAVNETLDASKVMSVAALHMQAAFNGAAASVWLCDAGGTEISPRPSLCVGMDEESEIYCVAAAVGIASKASVQTIALPGCSPADEVQSFEYLQAPLICRGAVLGKIGVIRAAGRFRETELGLLDSIGLHVATALENAKQYWSARDAADKDAVTGLLNHRSVHEYLDTVIELQAMCEEPLAVILADIDSFHMFNNTYGHPIGDDVLCQVAAIVDGFVKAPGKVGRYRSDEYLIVLPGYDSGQAVEFARALQEKISGLKLQYGGDDRTIPISLSFGIASFPADSVDRQDLLVTADTNLSSAKNSDAHIVALSEMQRAHRELRVSSSFRMLDGMVTAVDNKDRYTRRHSEDVTEFALLIADELGLSDEMKQTLRIGGLLHDVGKICVPDEILRKPSRLTDEEYNVLKQHPALGALIVGGVSGMEDILDAVKYHHEQWDGKGYPEGLAGTEIPFIARLVAVADAMSAMTTDRPYRKGLTITKALDQIRKNIGAQFDPDIAEAFLRVAAVRYTVSGEDEGRELARAA